MLSRAPCANHPDRPAQITCARCGTFVCAGCVVSGDLCADCKSRLLRERTPWTPKEKARARARRCLRWSQRSLSAVTALTLVALVLHLAAEEGALPPGFAGASQGLLALGAALGLGLVALAGSGYVSSEGGRPGPAVPGVFPLSSAALLIAVGLAPILAVVALLR